MKPFNLQQAKQGKPVCTRDGCKVRIICFDANTSDFPIVALITAKSNNKEYIYRHTINGSYSANDTREYGLDLMMVKETININGHEVPKSVTKETGNREVRDFSAVVSECIDIVNNHSNWIGVDERLPDEQGYYLVVSDNCVDMGFYSTHGVQKKFINYFNRNFDESVTYWQPLPEPPRGE